MGKQIVSFKGVTKGFDNQTVVDNISLDIYGGEFLTLLGPSGCGKTTMLRMIAGLESCDEGQVIINGVVSNDIPAAERDVNTVFQSYALFPHMTVLQNIAFGLSLKGRPEAEILEKVEEALAMVKLAGFGERRIQRLSGGQQQRVAIARAIVNEPLILLLDEPLSALDHKLRKEMRLELRQLHRKLGITFIFVTHDQEEALTMSDRIVVMNNGKIEQTGEPKEIYEEPANLFVADFIGESNFFDGRVTGTDGHWMDILVEDVAMTVRNRRGFFVNQDIRVLLRPEDMVIQRASDDCDQPHLKGRVEELIYKGNTVDLVIRLNSGKRIATTEFFNEDAEEIFYAQNEAVCISWIQGWEVVLPNE